MASWDEEFDLVCVGSGVGGCAAAAAGAEAGLKAVLLEKEARVGGQSAWSQGIVWVGNTGAAENDSPEDTRAYLDYLGAGRNDPEFTASFVQQAPRALRFFQERGVALYAVMGLPDHWYPLGAGSKSGGRSHQVRLFDAKSLGEWREKLEFTPYGHGRVTFEDMAAWGGRAGYRNWDKAVLAQREADDLRAQGAGLAGHFFKAVVDRQVPVRVQTRADRLVVEDGRVTGVEVETPSGPQRIGARKGVVLAAGDYNASQRLMGWWDEFSSNPPTGAPRNQGEGFVMGAEVGAAFAVGHWKLVSQLGYSVPGEAYEGQPLARTAGARELAYPHSILVNRQGRRFADEAAFGDVTTALREFDADSHELVNVPAYFVFDSQYLSKYGLQPVPPGADPPDWLTQANSLEELGRKLGIDADGLCTTVERFNGWVAKGADEDFHRGHIPWSNRAAGDSSQKNPNLGSISEPPFFGLKLLTTGTSAVGLVTNSHGQVVHLRGHAIPGLYACGDVMAQRHVGVGYQAGLSLSGAMTYGWLAAQHAAGVRF
ncbi:MAG TPA: FAD-dependent oxidoreductase [Chloroflexota bacterium]|nr:FAD-dependent oxidoreductase [Chloroflexota bacterium]